MIYVYSCRSCSKEFDVVKSVAEMDAEERCACGALAKREFVPRSVHFVGAKVEHPEWNPAFGCVVKSKYHRSELAKAHGVEEIGNEKIESIEKKLSKDRDDKKEQTYNEAFQEARDLAATPASIKEATGG